MSSSSPTRHAVVIGAGIVGVCCAYELWRDGYRVTLVEHASPGGEQAASYGNGAWLSPSSVVPMSMPGLWKKIPGYLFNADSPLRLRWWALPMLAPWLLRFLLAGRSKAQVQVTARALSQLLHDAPERHRVLADAVGRPELIRKAGLLYPYPTRDSFLAEALAWQLRRENGIVWEEVEGDRLRALAPDLGPHYRFGIHVPAGGNCTNPGDYVAAIATFLQARGVALKQARALDFARAGAAPSGALEAVLTDQGRIDCDLAIIAAGVHSRALAQAAGDRVFLESERGYHVVFEQPGFEVTPPLMPGDAKMAITSTTRGFRVSGQVELATIGAAPDWGRAELLRRFALNHFPALAGNADHTARIDGTHLPKGLKRWMGHRPSTPDGLPVLGPSQGTRGVFHAFGHGHVGLASAPASARLLADLIRGGPSIFDARPYAIQRFRRG